METSFARLIAVLLPFAFITTGAIAWFTCDDGRLLYSVFFCDGYRHCRDGSDEKPANFPTYPDNTKSPYMSCDNKYDWNLANKVCALRRQEYCRGDIECVNTTLCGGPCTSHFQCPNSTCWKRSTVCDGDPCNDCPAFQHWNNGHGFKCVRNGGMCDLPQLFLWDGIADCDDKSDLCYSSENGDASDTRRYSSFNNASCFQCLNDPMIIPRSSVCDNVIDCPDMSDECGCSGKSPSLCKNDIDKNYGTNRRCNCFDIDGVCHNIISETSISCDLTIDEICDKLAPCNGNSPCEYLCPSHFQCPNSTCWKRSTVCDGNRCNDCPAFQHWNNGHGFKCVRNGRMCNLPQLFLWDGIADCDDKSDLCYSSENGDVRFILLFSECPDKSDECFCAKTTREECGEFLSNKGAKRKNKNTEISCIMETPNQTEGVWFCREWNNRLLDNKLLCDGKRDCQGWIGNYLPPHQLHPHDEDPQLCKHRYICKAKDGLPNIPQSKVCDGFIDCVNGNDEYPEEKCKQQRRFYCPVQGGVKISVNNSDVCDFIFNCDDQSDETNCTRDGRFYCYSKRPLFVKKEKVDNGISDCSDSSDERIFSSEYELIANPVLRAIVWIMAFNAIFGNLVVMVTELHTLATSKARSAAFYANHLLVLNLSVSDLLMGVYLIMLGAAGARYSGSYGANDLVWRSSGGCTTLGVLVMLSSETSVLTMVLLTIFRLYAVKNPFYASLKPELKTVILSIILSWAISFTIAFIPLISRFQHFYETKAWMNENPFFENVVVDFSTMEKFMKKFVVFQHNVKYNDKNGHISALTRVDNANSWTDYVDILETYNYTDLFKISGYFGYYSSNSVCISKFYVTLDDKAWAYSILIISFNFVAFLFVAVTYIWIYKKSTSSARQANERPGNERAAKQNKDMQKKIMRLIITDFFCWVPISIMAFVNLGGAPAPPVIYAVSAIILLPINSSLNPLIYSNAPKLLYDRIRDRLRGVCRRREPEERQENVAVVANRENLLVIEQESAF